MRQIRLVPTYFKEINTMSTVLVVDDSATEMEIITSCLRKGGLTVITANDGTDAMTKISNQKPDVIILDVVLPGRSSLNCVAI